MKKYTRIGPIQRTMAGNQPLESFMAVLKIIIKKILVMDGSCSPLRLQSVWMDSFPPLPPVFPPQNAYKNVFVIYFSWQCWLEMILGRVGPRIQKSNDFSQQMFQAQLRTHLKFQTSAMDKFGATETWSRLTKKTLCKAKKKINNKEKLYSHLTATLPSWISSPISTLSHFLKPLKGFFSFFLSNKVKHTYKV